MAARTSNSPDSAVQRRNALVASIAGYAIDGYDLLILGFLLPAISSTFRLDMATAASLLTATLAGAMAGGIAFGVLSDALGRVRTLLWSILLFSLATGLCALAPNFWSLVSARFVAGFGLGGEFGIGMTLVAEVWSATGRARAASYVALGWQLGALAAAIATPLLVPYVGWRGVFALCVIPAMGAFVLRRAVPEPALFRQRAKTASWSASLRALVSDRTSFSNSFALLVLCSIQNFGYYTLMVWLPSYLSRDLSYSLTKSSLWTCATICGMCVGIVSFGEIADRLGRRPAFLIFQAGAALGVFVYWHLTSSGALLVGGAAMGFFVNGMIGGYGALISELFPTAARSTAQNVLFNLGRGIGGLGPMGVGAFAASHSLGSAIALLSGVYVIDILVTYFMIPETRSQALA